MDRGVQVREVSPITSSASTKLWEWPTVLSLDAPLIAVLWQALFAQTFAVPLTWYHVTLLAVPVWLVYSADRLFDGWSADPRAAQTRRHRFYTAHRWKVVGVWLVLLTGSLVVTALTLRPSELAGGLLVLGATSAYFVYLHLLPENLAVPKEILVALLFGAGAALFLTPFAVLDLWPPLLLFTLLCALNCGLISDWERALEAQPHKSLVGYPHLTARLPHAALGLACAALLLIPTQPQVTPLYGAIASSALALFELDRARLGRGALRVLGDAALLTPAPLLLAFWLAGG